MTSRSYFASSAAVSAGPGWLTKRYSMTIPCSLARSTILWYFPACSGGALRNSTLFAAWAGTQASNSSQTNHDINLPNIPCNSPR
ncbi:hypothetical protein FQZ97_1084210 [compost metagenome]